MRRLRSLFRGGFCGGSPRGVGSMPQFPYRETRRRKSDVGNMPQAAIPAILPGYHAVNELLLFFGRTGQIDAGSFYVVMA